ncbi:MAG TPA: hypothetical protein PK096_03700 [Candidatus Saccharibacteria bacterium]|nr:hypothetical protein [Candidatus Saccharibacteria bacterium]HRK94447.1 hypothetical protein [Candidatus Saccharibacteria bacterium]
MKILHWLQGLYNRTNKAVKIAVLVSVLSFGSVGAYLEHNFQFISKSLVPAIGGGNIPDKTEQSTQIAEDSATSGGKKGTTSEGKKSTSSTGKKPASSSSSSSGGTSSGGSSGQSNGGSATPTTPSSTAHEKFGMSAPTNLWNQRLSEVGASNINFRRIFYQEFGDSLTKVSETINAGMTPVISWKTGSYSWAQVAAGAADGELQSLVSRLNAIPGKKYLVIHHEPAGDGTASDFVAMQLHALPILGTASQASVGIIANGWWWSAQNQGYSDSEIAQWIPSSLKNVCDFIGADTYQDDQLVEDGSVKASRLAAWARRTGGVSALGIGEFNGFTASSITNVMNVVKADTLFKWALVWNSGPSGLGTPLEGARLQAFINGKSTPNPT